jgi:hypothetical protein
MKKDDINPKDLPIYKKGKDIFEVIDQICQLIPDDDEELNEVKEIMYEDAMILTAKIARATPGSLYDIKMEAATLIRQAANELMLQNHTLEMFGFEYIEYYDIVRKLIEEYRILFIEWVSNFDTKNYIIDRWGLFNPPGVNPDDINPDDIPFDGPDDFDVDNKDEDDKDEYPFFGPEDPDDFD